MLPPDPTTIAFPAGTDCGIGSRVGHPQVGKDCLCMSCLIGSGRHCCLCDKCMRGPDIKRGYRIAVYRYQGVYVRDHHVIVLCVYHKILKAAKKHVS